MSNIRPLRDLVLVKPIEKETKTAGGIILGDSAKTQRQYGKVIDMGPDCDIVTEGDVILLDWSKTALVNHQGVEMVLISTEFIHAIIED